MMEDVVVELIFDGIVIRQMVMPHAYPIIETPMSPSMEIIPYETFPPTMEIMTCIWRYTDARQCECGHGAIHQYEFVGVKR